MILSFGAVADAEVQIVCHYSEYDDIEQSLLRKFCVKNPYQVIAIFTQCLIVPRKAQDIIEKRLAWKSNFLVMQPEFSWQTSKKYFTC